MIVLACAAVLLAILVLTGRLADRRLPAMRLVGALLAGLAAAAAVVCGLREQWFGAAGMLALSAWLAQSARPARAGRTGPDNLPMSAAQARSILGLASGASDHEIETAYRRLMLRAHPDQGGSSGLAAQLNAARDRLLGRRS
jgi:hypothetical protein